MVAARRLSEETGDFKVASLRTFEQMAEAVATRAVPPAVLDRLLASGDGPEGGAQGEGVGGGLEAVGGGGTAALLGGVCRS